jgi:phenylacetate-CoA ligase
MDKKKIYTKLPYFMKSLSLSVWGGYLRRWRYGPETERLVEETLVRDAWSREQWTTWREERLAYILHHAAISVPYYRDQWQLRRKQGDRSSWELLGNWPKLDKAVVRENPRQFISEKSAGKRLYIDHTGGTTGKPTIIYQSREVTRQWFAIHEARLRKWNSLDYHDRWGIFGGQKIISLEQKKPPFWVWNQGLNQVYFSIFHISQKSTRDYVEALWRYKPEYLIVYPSALHVLARSIIQERLEVPRLKVIISNSEALTPTYRALIQEAFACPVRDTYGMAEMLSAASECSEGTMHYWPETGFMEIYDPKSESISPNKGHGLFCLTGLLNDDMPLIRYINGDVGSLPGWDPSCKCGRTLPLMDQIDGRSNDLVLTLDGRELYILDSLYNGLPIIEGQLIQISMSQFEVKVVSGKGCVEEAIEKDIKMRLRQYLGEVDILINWVSAIPRERNAKFKPFISLINPIDP